MIKAIARILPWVFGFCATAKAFDTYYLRERVDLARTSTDAKTFFTGKGCDTGKGQPFMNTHVLVQSDTNYVLVVITPKDATEDAQAKIQFSLAGVDLYQVYALTDKGPVIKTDNSAQFPVWFDWTVKTSTPGHK